MAIFYIINLIVYLHTSSEIIKYLYPNIYHGFVNKLKSVTIKVGTNTIYKTIYYYSILQLWSIKLKINFNKFTEHYKIHNIGFFDVLKNYFLSDFINDYDTDEYLYYVKDGIIIDSCFTHLIEKNKDIVYDFILYNNNNCGIINKKIPYHLNYEFTSYKFIQIMIDFQDNNMEIHLSNNDYNYYIVNNFIDSSFILYFLRTHYTSQVYQYDNNYLLNYKLTIIDYDVNFFEIDNTQTITFKENKYDVSEKQNKNIDNNIEIYEINEFNAIEELIDSIHNIKYEISNTSSIKSDIILEAENRKVTDSMFFSQPKKDKLNELLEDDIENEFIMDFVK